MRVPVKLIAFGILGLFVLMILSGSFYTVEPSERAGLRYFGTVTTKEPIGPGLHFKLPLVTSVDEITVTQQTMHIEPFVVNTVDNQRIQMEINIAYSIPDDAVFHLLYEVGKSDGGSRASAIIPIVQDRVGRILSSKNTNFISAQRESIQAEITTSVERALKELFKIDVKSLQIAAIRFSDAFNQSNDNAVLAKNAAVAEENKKKVIEYQAQQRVIAAEGAAREAVATAEGEAKAAIARAEAAKTAAILKAEADKITREMAGQGEGAKLKAEIDALGGPANYLALQNTKVLQQWNGSVPSNVMNTGTGSPFLFQLPSAK